MKIVSHEVPAISVILSCYNGERWLSEAIKSVLAQTLKQIEVVLVDDGSTDRSLSIMKKFASEDSRILVFPKKNSGLASSLNYGIERARGRWIARLDADDISEPCRLEKQLEAALKDEKCVFVGAGLRFTDEDGRLSKGSGYSYPSNHEALQRRLTSSKGFPAHSSAFFKADAVRALGGYRSRIKRAEDMDLWLRLSEYGQLTSVGEPLVRIRQHSSQISKEEGGRHSIEDYQIALISYWLRSMGQVDPVERLDDLEFGRFKKWAIIRLNSSRIFEMYHYRAQAKAFITGSQRFSYAAMHFFMTKPILLVRILFERARGKTIARRLAIEYARGDCCPVA